MEIKPSICLFTTFSTLFIGSILFSTATFAASGTNKGTNPNGKPFIEIAGQIIEIEGAISSLQDQIDSLIGRVDSIEAEQTALQNAIANLQDTSADLQAQIDANALDIDSMQTQIDNLTVENADLQNQIDQLGDTDGSLQAQIDSNNTTITALQQSIEELSTLQGQIDNNSALIAVMQNEIDALQYGIDMKQNIINGKCWNGYAIREILPDGSVICEYDDVGTIGQLSAYQTYKSVSVQPGFSTTVTAYCTSGYRPMSAGHYGYEMNNYFSYTNPFSGGYATASFKNSGSYTKTGYVYAICAKVQQRSS